MIRIICDQCGEILEKNTSTIFIDSETGERTEYNFCNTTCMMQFLTNEAEKER